MPTLIFPDPYQLLEPSLTRAAGVQVVSRPHMYRAMLVCVPGPGQGEHTVDSGSDEYPDWQGDMTDLEHLLP